MFFLANSLILNLSKALLLTLFIEVVVLLFLRVKPKVLLLSILLNCITNISLNLFIQVIPPSQYFLIVLGLEILIIFIEAICYMLVIKGFQKALKISFFCNMSSYLIGLILFPFLY